DEGEGADAHHRDEHVQDLLGGVGRRRQVVAGEHGQGGRLAEALVLELVGVQGRAEQPALPPGGEPVGRRGGGGVRPVGSRGFVGRRAPGRGAGLGGGGCLRRHERSLRPRPPPGALASGAPGGGRAQAAVAWGSAGSSASSSTWATSSTGWKVISRRTASGTSSRSGS